MSGNRKIQIIATGITTLDEARYFAAMGADWIGFNAEQLSTNEIKTIADWVVGPKKFVEIQVLQDDVLFEISNKVALDGVSIHLDAAIPAWFEGRIILNSHFSTQRHILNTLRNETVVIRLQTFPTAQDVLDDLHRICIKNTCWIEIDATQISLTDVCGIVPLHGIVIRCIEEVRNREDLYVDYDTFFEEMEILREN